MNHTAVVTDNVTEALIKIIEFTQTRQKVLTRNVNNMHSAGFVPKDLPVDEFSKLMHEAIEEHMRSQRLLLRDGSNVKFGPMGSFEVMPIADEYARQLLEENRDEYLKLQIDKLLENSLNQRIAVEILRQKLGDELNFPLNLN